MNSKACNIKSVYPFKQIHGSFLALCKFLSQNKISGKHDAELSYFTSKHPVYLQGLFSR